MEPKMMNTFDIFGIMGFLNKLLEDDSLSSEYDDLMITDVKVIVPELVVQVSFNDGTSEKMVCKPPDVFSLEQALYIAIAKKLYRKEYTFEGIEIKTEELKIRKKYVKIVEKGLKLYKKKCKEETIANEQEKQKKTKKIKSKKHIKKQNMNKEFTNGL